MGDGREAGVFLGHTEGLTYVDSKGDGRYVLSNAKDQTAKLWDLRKMMSKEKADGIDPNAYTTRFEYRSDGYDPTSGLIPTIARSLRSADTRCSRRSSGAISRHPVVRIRVTSTLEVMMALCIFGTRPRCTNCM
jgi:WD40 repeat protein